MEIMKIIEDLIADGDMISEEPEKILSEWEELRKKGDGDVPAPNKNDKI